MDEYIKAKREIKSELELRMAEILTKYSSKKLSNSQQEMYASEFADAIEEYFGRMYAVEQVFKDVLDSQK